MPPTCKQDGSSACRNTTFYKHTGRRGTSVTICAPLNGGTPAGFTWKTVQPAAPERFSADATGTGLTPSPARCSFQVWLTVFVIAFCVFYIIVKNPLHRQGVFSFLYILFSSVLISSMPFHPVQQHYEHNNQYKQYDAF